MKEWLKEESGQALTEYVLIIVLLAVTASAGVIAMRDEMAIIYGKIQNAVERASR